MPISYSRALVTALAVTAISALPVSAQDVEHNSSRPSFWQVFTIENFATAFVHSALSWSRLLADIRYDQISIDPLALRLTLTGVSIAPNLPDVAPGACTVTVERLTLNGRALDHFDKARMRMALDGVSMPSTCLPVELGGMMRGFGYSALDIPRVEAEFNYDYPSGGADIRITADLDRLASVQAAIDLDYISYRMDFDTEEPVIGIDLRHAQLSIEDTGGWDLAKKLLPPSALEPDALAKAISGGLAQAMNEASRSENGLSATQQAFANQAGEIARGFDAGKRRVVLTTQIKNAPLRLNEAAFQEFTPLFDQLNPTVTTYAPALNTTISVAQLSTMHDSEQPPANAFELGRALITGIGAPRNVASGLQMLAPLARQGNTDASMLVAQAVETNNPTAAYAHALRATVANKPGALALLDRIERGLSFDEVAEKQNDMLATTDATLYGDLGAMRRASRDYLTGTNRPRSWRAAYYWAAMAAAAGDATGAALRDELNETMRLRGDAKAWAVETESLDNGVLRDWIGHDVPALLR